MCSGSLPDTLVFFSKGQIFGQGIHPADISVVTATGYFKKTTHFADGILFSVSIYDLVFYADLHSFPVSKRKSRNSSTSIFKRLFSYLYSARAFAGFRPRCFGMPCSSFFPFACKKMMDCLLLSPQVSPQPLAVSFRLQAFL